MPINELYTPALLEHSQDPFNKYAMENPTCTHEGINPSCGDDIVLSLRLSDSDIIEEAAFTGSGCAVSQASADMMADLVCGLDLAQARDLCKLFIQMARGEATDTELLTERLGEAACLKTIARMPARVKCAELAWRTLDQMLEDRQSGGTGSNLKAATTEDGIPGVRDL
ncbi:MAG: SUF system NifU family Fe-S cluster assembly protein [Coriobacteriales bacterium]|nr:SUF system NifU family Fe-S cluster assembly protein [Coriobacteriales bacterium]